MRHDHVETGGYAFDKNNLVLRWLSQACSKQCSLPPYTMNPENGAQYPSPVRARKGYVCLGVFGVCMPEDRKG